MSDFWRHFEGRTLNGRYDIGSYIGCGAMGGVFHTLDRRLGRRVAVKLIDTAQLPPLLADRHRRRFAREAAMAARINSPYVVAVYDFGSDGTLDYLVMELLDGVNLRDWLERNPSPSLDVRIGLVHQAALGLAAGHASGVVHRDVKPSNLIVLPQSDGNVSVKLVDFGIAKPLAPSSEEGTITTAGEFIGTPQYASPEQLRGEGDLSPSSDVFSLGILAYMLITGVHPFTEDDRTRLFNGSHVHVPSPQRHTPALPNALCDLILRALQASSAHRPQTAGAFANELVEVMRSSTLTARVPPVGEVFRDPTIELPPARTSQPQPQAPLRMRWRPNWKIARRSIAAVVVVGGSILGATVLRSRQAGPQPDDTPLGPIDVVQKRIAAREANDIGLRFVKSHDSDSAVIQFQRAVDLQPDHEEYLDNLGFALREAGELPESVALLEKVVARYPRRVSAHYNLAQSYLATGDTAKAIEHLGHYIPLADSAGAEAALRKIRLLKGR